MTVDESFERLEEVAREASERIRQQGETSVVLNCPKGLTMTQEQAKVAAERLMQHHQRRYTSRVEVLPDGSRRRVLIDREWPEGTFCVNEPAPARFRQVRVPVMLTVGHFASCFYKLHDGAVALNNKEVMELAPPLAGATITVRGRPNGNFSAEVEQPGKQPEKPPAPKPDALHSPARLWFPIFRKRPAASRARILGLVGLGLPSLVKELAEVTEGATSQEVAFADDLAAVATPADLKALALRHEALLAEERLKEVPK